MADDVTLLPCKCGAEPQESLQDYTYKVAIFCPACNEITDWHDNAPDAWESWNRARRNDDLRPILAASQSRIAELEGQVALLTAALANAEGQNPETWTAT